MKRVWTPKDWELVSEYFPPPYQIEFAEHNEDGFQDEWVIITDPIKKLTGRFLLRDRDTSASLELGLSRVKYKMDHWEPTND